MNKDNTQDPVLLWMVQAQFADNGALIDIGLYSNREDAIRKAQQIAVHRGYDPTPRMDTGSYYLIAPWGEQQCISITGFELR